MLKWLLSKTLVFALPTPKNRKEKRDNHKFLKKY
jgi:hypothetical protein